MFPFLTDFSLIKAYIIFQWTIEKASILLYYLFPLSFTQLPKHTSSNRSPSFSDLVPSSDLSSYIIGICSLRTSTYFLLILFQLLQSKWVDSTHEAHNYSSHWCLQWLVHKLVQTEPLKYHRLLLRLLGQRHMLFTTITTIVIFHHQRKVRDANPEWVKFGDAKREIWSWWHLLSPSTNPCLEPRSLGLFNYIYQ